MSELFKKAYNTATQMYNSGSSPIVRRATGGISKLIATEAGLQEMYPAPDGNYYTIDGFDERGLYDPKYDKTSDEFARKTLTDQYLLEKQQEAIKQAGGPQRGYSSQFGKSISVAKPGEASEKPVTLVNKFLATPSPINVTSQTADTTADQVDRAATEKANLAQAKIAADYFNRFMPPSAPKTTTHLDRIDYNPGFAGAGTVTTDDGSFTTIDDAAVDTVAAFKGGGGLSNINKTMMINGQPHKLAYINSDEASLLKAIGGSGRKVDGIPAYYFDDPGYMTEDIDEGYNEMTDSPTLYLSDDPRATYTTDRSGAIGLTSGIDPDFDPGLGVPSEEVIAEIAKAGQTPTAPSDALQDYNYFGEDGSFPTWGADALNRLALIDPDKPAPIAYAKTKDNLKYETGQRVPKNFLEILIDKIRGKESEDDTKFVSDKEYEQMYGKRAEFAAKLDNKANQWAAGINKVKSDIDRRSEEDPKTPEEIEKEERKGLLEVAEKIFDKGSFVENKGQGIPGYAASYGLASLFGAMGLLGTAEIDGIPVHVHEDGSVTPVSPEDEPGFDQSKMDLGNESTYSSKRLPASTVADASKDASEDAPKTGIAALLAKRSDPVSLAQASEPSIQNLISLGIDPQAAREMFGMFNDTGSTGVV